LHRKKRLGQKYLIFNGTGAIRMVGPMHWLQTCDVELFRWINLTLSNPVLDGVMPFLSGNDVSRAILWPLTVLGGSMLLWKGGARGRICVLALAVVLAAGDGLVCNMIKQAVARDRPFLVLADARCLVGKGGSGSMPSSHAANWFAAAFILLVYYRRTVWLMAPAAALVGFSRIYNGVHYPSDVLAGAILGAGYAAAGLWLMNSAWRWAGHKWFPLWWERVPSLVAPPTRARGQGEEGIEDDAPLPSRPPPKVRGIAPVGFQAPHVSLDEHWVRLGYILIGVLLLARFAYIASGTIQLEEDEAYQWLWSKHLALSYYSKPPLIAYAQFLGTSIWGDTAFGVRFFSPVIGAVLSVMVLRFFAREVNARAGFFLVLILTATPLAALGTILMTVDPLSVLFWSAAMFAGWRAVQEKATTRDWLWVGLWMGLGFLSKYTALFQWLCWAVFFALSPPARKQLRRPGPYLALLVNLVCTLPVLIWNWQRDWVTVSHVADDAGAHQGWEHPVRFPLEFLGMEFALLNPVFFAGMVWAGIALWRRGRNNPKLTYFFCMGAPLFLSYFLYSFRSRILPNWIAPSLLPLFCMMVIYWDARLRLGVASVKRWLAAGLVVGFVAVTVAHQTDLWRGTFRAREAVARLFPNIPWTWLNDLLTKEYLPVRFDPLHRVRDWDTTARAVGEARQELLAEGKPVFIIVDHYGFAGQFSFYLPEARNAVREQPLVYHRTSQTPENQFYFWPGYLERKGENAIFILELDRAKPVPKSTPDWLAAEFESVTDLGVRNVMYHGGLLRPLQVFGCRGLK
jgi:4-amino-4-deoxy-L-arabinose transferase-like glycosyltransferase/membrane-associated phospholipid phosphatase